MFQGAGWGEERERREREKEKERERERERERSEERPNEDMKNVRRCEQSENALALLSPINGEN